MQLVIQIFGAFSETVELTNSVCQVVVQTWDKTALVDRRGNMLQGDWQ